MMSSIFHLNACRHVFGHILGCQFAHFLSRKVATPQAVRIVKVCDKSRNDGVDRGTFVQFGRKNLS